MTLAQTPEVQNLVAALRQLPPGAQGKHDENGRFLRLTRGQGRVELHLRMNLGGGHEPLLQAIVSYAEANPAEPSVQSIAMRQRTDHFDRQQLKYLAAMCNWAVQALATHGARFLRLRTRDAVPSPRRALLDDILKRVCGPRSAARKRFFDNDDFSFDDLADAEHAERLCLFLRDEGHLLQLDWHDDVDLPSEFTRLLRKAGLRGGLELAAMPDDDEGDAIASVADRVSEAAQPLGYSLLTLDSGMDSHWFIALRSEHVGDVVMAFHQLGLRAAVR